MTAKKSNTKATYLHMPRSQKQVYSTLTAPRTAWFKMVLFTFYIQKHNPLAATTTACCPHL